MNIAALGSGNSNTGKTDSSDVNEVIILRLVNEENSVVGQYVWFYNVFLK